MNISINYFGLIAEITHCHKESVEFSGSTILELRECLYQKYPALKQISFQVAQNQVLVNDKTSITGKEIALLPPFSGG